MRFSLDLRRTLDSGTNMAYGVAIEVPRPGFTLFFCFSNQLDLNLN